MPTFERIQGAVYCDGLSLAELATRFGTPLYTYDAGAIAARYREIEDAFRDGISLIEWPERLPVLWPEAPRACCCWASAC